MTKTSDALEVVWEGTLLPGLIFYALATPPWAPPEFPSIWGPRWLRQTLSGPGWLAYIWNVQVALWPPNEVFRQQVLKTFHRLLEGGAAVAWIGLEGGFSDPPDLFSPDLMTGAVVAAALPDGRNWTPASLDHELATLPGVVLEELRRALPHGARAGGTSQEP